MDGAGDSDGVVTAAEGVGVSTGGELWIEAKKYGRKQSKGMTSVVEDFRKGLREICSFTRPEQLECIGSLLVKEVRVFREAEEEGQVIWGGGRDCGGRIQFVGCICFSSSKGRAELPQFIIVPAGCNGRHWSTFAQWVRFSWAGRFFPVGRRPEQEVQRAVAAAFTPGSGRLLERFWIRSQLLLWNI